MDKELVKEYFSHDCGARNDPDMVPLFEDFKSSGYGIYWAVIEMMHERKGPIPFNENTFKLVARLLNEKASKVKEVAEKCVQVYHLFFMEGTNFCSHRVLKNLNERKKSVEQRINAGKASAEKRKRELNDLRTTVEQRKERKGNEKKDSEGGVPEILYGNKSVKAPKEQEVHEAFVRMGGTQDQAKKFFDKYDATGWMIKGTPIMKWTSLIRSFIDTWAEIRKENGDIENSGKPKMIYA